MMIEIASQGGFAGLPATAPPKTVEVETLEQPMRERVCEAFAPDNLRRLSETAEGPGADRLTYEITVEGDAGRDTFTVPEGALPPEMLDMIDDL